MGKDTSSAKRYGENIRKELAHWKDLYEHGGSDPFWEDGFNLNLVRNHILYYRKQIEDELQPSEYPDEYFLEIPPEVDNRYMVKAAEIPDQAKAALGVMERDPDYRYLLRAITKMDQTQQKATCIEAVLRYVSSARAAIETGNMLDMRRKVNPQTYIDSFRECRKKVEELLRQPEAITYPDNYQLTMFDVYGMA